MKADPGSRSQEPSDRQPPSRDLVRSWIGKTLLTFGSFILCLGIAEAVVGSLSDQTLGFRYNLEHRRFARPVEFELDRSPNSLGFHDVEPSPKLPGRLQVLLLGDSYVESYSAHSSVNVGQRIQYHLGTIGTPARVVSLGKSGWGQREQLRALRDYGARVAPDLVVTLFLPLNDVENNSLELRSLMRSQRSDSESLYRPGWTQRDADTMPFFWIERSALNQLISHRLAIHEMRSVDRTAASIPVDYFVYATEVDETWQKAWASTERLIVETARQARALGARYVVGSASTPQGVLGPEAGLAALIESYPAMQKRDWDLLLPERRMAAICQRHGIPFVPLEPRFRDETASGRSLHWRYDGHWNAAGNDLAGQLLAEFIRALEAP